MKETLQRPYVSAIIPAAGSGERMEGLDKKFIFLADVPILVRTMLAVAASDWIDEIVVVVRKDEIPILLRLIGEYQVPKIRSVVAGGVSRQQSVQKGIEAVSEQTQIVAIHDGARPLVSTKVIAETVLDALTRGAAAAAVPVVDTIKVAAPDRSIASTPDRRSLYAVQTPQVFDLAQYRAAADAATDQGKEYTDDCQMLEAIGQPVYLSQGDYANIKITTPDDLAIVQALIEFREATQ